MTATRKQNYNCGSTQVLATTGECVGNTITG